MEIPLGPFLLTRMIGLGGAGEVWEGTQVAQGVKVAVKVITAARARDPRFREAFAHEVRAIAGLDHPGVALVFDSGEVDGAAEAASLGRMVAGSPYLAMGSRAARSAPRSRRPTGSPSEASCSGCSTRSATPTRAGWCTAT